MQKILDQSFRKALGKYIEARGIKQKDLTKSLEWSNSLICALLNGRRNFGRKTQNDLIKMLGRGFEIEVCKEIRVLLNEYWLQMNPVEANAKTENLKEFKIEKFCTPEEQKYIDKLVDIFLGVNEYAKMDAKLSIDNLHSLRNENKKVDVAYIEKLRDSKSIED